MHVLTMGSSHDIGCLVNEPDHLLDAPHAAVDDALHDSDQPFERRVVLELQVSETINADKEIAERNETRKRRGGR